MWVLGFIIGYGKDCVFVHSLGLILVIRSAALPVKVGRFSYLAIFVCSAEKTNDPQNSPLY